MSIAIYGTGEIGTVVAEDLCRLGFNVNGWSRAKKNNKFFRSFHGIQGFLDLNKNSDIHISLLPLTKETEGIFNKTFFSNVKTNSCFINAGRGDQVIEEDLLWACRENKVKIAILDVYRNEPLPIDHPFWENSKIIIWPHVSAETNHKTSAAQVAKAIKLNHKRYQLLEELLVEFNISKIRNSLGITLSGGERRRVEIARTLASNPSHILLDEPFAGIDPIAVKDLKKLIYYLKNKGIGILITDHNVRDTLEIVEKAYILYDGNVLMSGTPKEITSNKDVKDVYLGDDFSLF